MYEYDDTGRSFHVLTQHLPLTCEVTSAPYQVHFMRQTLAAAYLHCMFLLLRC